MRNFDKDNLNVDNEKTDNTCVEAMIEVKVTPQRESGFQRIAERIYQYPQVRTCYLMSGSFDIAAIVDGCSLEDVASFVAKKLATIDGVQSTSTLFVLKKYKENGVVLEQEHRENREPVVL